MSHDFSSVPAQVNPAPYSPAPSQFSQSSMENPPRPQQQQTQQPHHPAQPPPQGAYASPNSYPSPSMQPTYSYPPPGQQQEPYRGSPPNMSLPPLNLPPIRLQDGQQPPPQQHPQHQQHQQPPQQPMGSPLPPPQHAMQQHYPPPGYAHPGQPMNMGPAQYGAMRYQLPPQADQRVLSGGRHKKEIKRRTKTGCLTCRKRRIKVSADLNGLRLADAS